MLSQQCKTYGHRPEPRWMLVITRSDAKTFSQSVTSTYVIKLLFNIATSIRLLIPYIK